MFIALDVVCNPSKFKASKRDERKLKLGETLTQFPKQQLKQKTRKFKTGPCQLPLH